MIRSRGNGVGARPGQLSARESALRSAFLSQVERIPGGDRLRRCIQCGTCSGSCPVSSAMDIQPRQLVAYFRAGDLESILRSRTLWLCASCYACTVRCPAGIKITELIYGLKRMALESHIHARGLPTQALSRQFISLVKRYGRNQELQLSLLTYLRMSPRSLLGSIPLGWRMWRAGRLPLRVSRVRAIEGLRKIIARAEAMEQIIPKEQSRALSKVGYGVVSEEWTAQGGGR